MSDVEPMEATELRELIRELLTIAADENGYLKDIQAMTPAEVLADIRECSGECIDAPDEAAIPIIEEWLRERATTSTGAA